MLYYLELIYWVRNETRQSAHQFPSLRPKYLWGSKSLVHTVLSPRRRSQSRYLTMEIPPQSARMRMMGEVKLPVI